MPDLTLLLDLPAEVGLARRQDAGATDHFDLLPREFHERVRAGYLELARESPTSWRIIDATQSFDAVLEEAYEAVRRIIDRGPGTRGRRTGLI